MVQEKTYKKPHLRRTPRRRAWRDMLARMSSEPSTTTPDPRTHEFVSSVVVARPRHELYVFWRDFTNAPKFMARVESVTEVDSLSSVWTLKDEAGKAVQWEMLVTEDEPDRLIAWSPSGNTPVSYSGRVEFQDAEGSGGTQITATVRHEEHPGLVETLIEAVAGPPKEHDPPVQSPGDLDRFKAYIEALPAPGQAAAG